MDRFARLDVVSGNNEVEDATHIYRHSLLRRVDNVQVECVHYTCIPQNTALAQFRERSELLRQLAQLAPRSVRNAHLVLNLETCKLLKEKAI